MQPFRGAETEPAAPSTSSRAAAGGSVSLGVCSRSPAGFTGVRAAVDCFFRFWKRLAHPRLTLLRHGLNISASKAGIRTRDTPISAPLSPAGRRLRRGVTSARHIAALIFFSPSASCSRPEHLQLQQSPRGGDEKWTARSGLSKSGLHGTK